MTRLLPERDAENGRAASAAKITQPLKTPRGDDASTMRHPARETGM
jgi:hypothetical protein